MRDGLLGLILFIGHWLSPETGTASISVEFLKDETLSYQFLCKFDIAWNRQLEQLVDAGIPLRFNIHCFSDKSDTLRFTRTLLFDMVNFTYNFLDSAAGTVKSSESYKLVHLALRDFCKWKFSVSKDANLCRVEIAILPGMARELNRVVDMSRVWGQQKIFYQFAPKKMLKPDSQRRGEKK